MADWLKPQTTDLYTDVLAQLDARLNDCATMFNGSISTNLPIGTYRISGSDNLEKYTGTAWGLASLNVQKLIIGPNNYTTISDIHIIGTGNLSARDSFHIYIDSVNTKTTTVFSVRANSYAYNNSIELFKVSESGRTFIPQHSAVSISGASGSLSVGIDNNWQLSIDRKTIQAKANNTTPSALDINPYGGNVNIQTIAGSGTLTIGSGTVNIPSASVNIDGTTTVKSPFRLKGNGVGTGNVDYMGFYESNNSTRQAYIGFGASTNTNFDIANEINNGTIYITNRTGTGTTYIAASFNAIKASLRYSNRVVMETNSSGIGIIGTPANNDPYINFYASNGTTLKAQIGNLSANNDTLYVKNARNGAGTVIQVNDSVGTGYNQVYVAPNGVYLRYYGSNKLQTTSAGVTVTGTGTATDWIATSDRRLKSNLEEITGALSKLYKVHGYTYNKKGLEGRRTAGLIAQDVETVFPEAVFGEDTLALSSSALIALIVEAIKELAEEVRR